MTRGWLIKPLIATIPQERKNSQVKAYDWSKRWWKWNETTKAHLAEFYG